MILTHRSDVAFKDKKELKECVHGTQRAGGKRKKVQSATAIVADHELKWTKIERLSDAEL